MRGYYDLNTQLNKNITSEDEDENKMKVSIFESESKLFSVLNCLHDKNFTMKLFIFFFNISFVIVLTIF